MKIRIEKNVKNFIFIVIALVILGAVAYYALNLPKYSAAPTTTTTTIQQQAEIQVSSQALGSEVTIDSIYLDKPGFIVIHKDSNGSPGAVIGHSNLLQGEISNLEVAITENATKVWAMLHYDDDNDGEYGFPDEDKPVVVEGKAVVKTVEAQGGIGKAVDTSIEDLAARLSVSESAIAIESADPVEWPDTSLGCPQPGQVYAQVVTPGFKVVLSHAGKNYNYHSDTSAESFLCEEQETTTTATTTTISAVKEFIVEADDNGLYPSSINVSKGDKVRITFKARSQGVYYGGLDFRSSVWGDTGKVPPGGNTTVNFTAQSSFTYTSYWPASGVPKADGRINVAG